MAFSNMTMEVAPGKDMKMAGPIFSNKDIWLCVSNGYTLEVRGTLAAVGDIKWGRAVQDTVSSTTQTQKGVVQLTSAFNEKAAKGTDPFSLTAFYDDAGKPKYYDSTSSDWKAQENKLFDSWVQSAVDDVAERRFAGITDLANAHAVIESPIKDGNTAAGYDKNVELQKFSNKAGVIIRPPTISNIRTNTSTWKKVTKKKVSGGTTTPVSETTTPNTNEAISTQGPTVWAYVEKASGSGSDEGPFTREKADGSTGTFYLVDITSSVANLNKIVTITSGTSQTKDSSDAGFYDHREDKWMTLYNIDTAELAKAVADTSGTLNTKWNGILYVDCSNSAATTSTESTTPVTQTSETKKEGGISYIYTTQEQITTKVETSTLNVDTNGSTGVRLINGTTLPAIPGAAADAKAFTLATNDPVYIQGNFNSDGIISTDDPEAIRDPDSESESMACIAADAITILSGSWKDWLSRNDSRDSRTASSTEVSAVFMTGIVTSNFGVNYSGGLNNFPRYLENWDSVRSGYRGSMLEFFRSNRATGYFNTTYFRPPTRIWGWDRRLEGGREVYGLGRVITFRRIRFSDLSPSSYASSTSGL